MIDWTVVQTRCRDAGFDPGALDGRPGPRTYAAMFSYVARRNLRDRARDLGVGAAQYFPRYEIDTPLRLAHFLGQTAHESGLYQFMREIWGPTETQLGYEGRRDLGNTVAGDGRLYLGRGILQVTGRANYRIAAKRIGIDIEANPQLVERPDVAVLVSCDWWQVNQCNRLADKDDAIALGRLINRGNAHSTRPANGEPERIALTVRAKGLFQ